MQQGHQRQMEDELTPSGATRRTRAGAILYPAKQPDSAGDHTKIIGERAMPRTHTYRVTIDWTGNRGVGTADYRAYGRDYLIRAAGKLGIDGSSDPAFRGDKARWNPEELLVASVSACHQLWYLHLCAVAGIPVLTYSDDAEGSMVEQADGSGQFAQVTLRPQIRIPPEADLARALHLHHEAHAKCFIANSVNFPILCEPRIITDDPGALAS
jgi:organic hydroperoxide reductase OsmC/OhrA